MARYQDNITKTNKSQQDLRPLAFFRAHSKQKNMSNHANKKNNLYWTFIDGVKETFDNFNLAFNRAQIAKSAIYCGGVVVFAFNQ